jgi:hypothetical protein
LKQGKLHWLFKQGKHLVKPLVILLYSVSALGIGIGIGNNLAAFHAIFTNNITLPSIPIPTPDFEKKIKKMSRSTTV